MGTFLVICVVVLFLDMIKEKNKTIKELRDKLNKVEE